MPRSTFILLMGLFCLLVIAGVTAITVQQWSPYSSTRVGGAFSMTEMTGDPVTEKTMLGKPTAMFFGYTYCPDVCPTTLLTLTNVMQRMGADANRLNVVFVTVDPQRDTAEQMKLYLSSFDPRIRGFIGTEQQLASMANRYHIPYRRVQTEGGGYSMDHYAGVLLFDKTGRLVGELPYEEPETSVFAKLETLVRPDACVKGAPPRVDLWSGVSMNDVCAS
ncbi:SCO family protein [Lichenihabitans sp. PAMC28606]|uniref:SCO family protein n=1 Tax=Lichenihabitans sp. PAMC28606 TaxID=2880932 RepID=UPI001D09F15D|nr:SCO family protein [Lichenihabitans sp. PAMC28606]UDL94041.1 SCO family protein [Lichenihabitans sp. PAMC28606]